MDGFTWAWPSIPAEWRPFVNSVHLQLYWETFQRDVEEVLEEGFETWGNYGLPVLPVLPGAAPRAEMNTARKLVISKYKATGSSWWRFGSIGPVEWPAINHAIGEVMAATTSSRPRARALRHRGVVTPESPRYRDGAFGGQDVNKLFKTFRNLWGWNTKYKTTAKTSSLVWARWDPDRVASGWYEVSAFVPSRHATTTRARYKVHGAQGSSGELEIPVRQASYYNVWVPLGVYQFDANNAQAGVVFLNDLTGEENKEIC